jgi:very-short-patch-repair endonuclease
MHSRGERAGHGRSDDARWYSHHHTCAHDNDLSAHAEQRELERALAEAFAQRLTNSDDIRALLTRYPGRRGTRRLQDLLERGSRPALTRSQAEERFLALTRKGQLQDPEVNVTLEGYEVDFLWRQERLVVEIDGRAFHSSDRTFESDRRRDAVLLAAGLRVMRVTWRQIVSEPEALLVRLTRTLIAVARV